MSAGPKVWQNASPTYCSLFAMTSILALDSSTDACSVALYQDGRVTGLFELASKSHTQRLLPMVDQLLREAGVGLPALDAIAFGRGPGSFTGLRICLGVVQGLAFGARKPVIPVSTLAAMALAYYQHQPDQREPDARLPCLVALDARMDEIYWALYRPGQASQTPELLNSEQVTPPALVAQDPQLVDFKGEFVALGQGWHYPQLDAVRPAICQQAVYPQAEQIAWIAAESWAKGDHQNVMEAEPVYLRDKVSWQKRQRIRPVAPSPLS